MNHPEQRWILVPYLGRCCTKSFVVTRNQEPQLRLFIFQLLDYNSHRLSVIYHASANYIMTKLFVASV